MKKENNNFACPFEIKSINSVKKEGGDEFFTFEGYASTFGNIDRVDDKIEPGAFKESISQMTPKLLLQHNPFEFPIGKIEEIREDQKGLYIKASMPKADKRVSDMIEPQMKLGSIDSMSIGYRTKSSDLDETTGIRTLKELEVFEISLVTFPANEKAVVTGVKSEFGIDDVEGVESKSEFEDLLKSTGAFSRKACTFLASRFQETQSDSGLPNKVDEQSDSVKNMMEQMSNAFASIKDETKKN